MRAIVAVLTLAATVLPAGAVAAQTSDEVRGTVLSVDVANGFILLGPDPLYWDNLRSGRYLSSRHSTRRAWTEAQAVEGEQAPAAATAAGEARSGQATVQVPGSRIVVQQAPARIIVQQGQPGAEMGPQTQMGQSETFGQPPTSGQTQPYGQAQPYSQAQPYGQAQDEGTVTVQREPGRATVQMPHSRIVVEQQPTQIIIQQAPQPRSMMQGPSRTQAPPAGGTWEQSMVRSRFDSGRTGEVQLSRTAPWCNGIYYPSVGSNFGKCDEEDKKKPGVQGGK
jgi:hypothetical protein